MNGLNIERRELESTAARYAYLKGLFGIPAGLLMLSSYAAGAVLRRHHVIIFGSLVVAGLLPVWDGADPSNTGLLLVGAAIIASGILDHRLLVRTFGPPKGVALSNAGA